MSTTVDMNRVVQLVTERGFDAYITNTGGGVFAMYAGHQDAEGYHPVVVGPFTSDGAADFAELWIGEDCGNEEEVNEVSALGIRNEEDLAKMVIAMCEKGGTLSFDEVEALGFDGTLRSIDPEVRKAQDKAAFFCDVYNAKLAELRSTMSITQAVDQAQRHALEVVGDPNEE